MRKIIGITAVLAFATSIASAELLKNFKYDGNIDVNAYQVRNADYNELAADKVNDAQTRVVLGAGFDLNDDVATKLTIAKIDEKYGTNNGAPEDIENETINEFAFYEGYLNIKGLMGFDHKLGRQLYGNPGDLLVYYGPLTWPYNIGLGLTATPALDGYSGYWKHEKWDIQGVLGKNTESCTILPCVGPDTDQDIFGLIAKYDLKEDIKLAGFVYRRNTQVGATPNDHLDVVGVKANGNFKGFDYSAEVAKNMGRNNTGGINTGLAAAPGTNNKYEGMGYLVNVKYSMDIASTLTFMGEYASGSGDDNYTDNKVSAFMGVQPDYRPGILWGGYGLTGAAGFAGITNLTTYNLGAEYVFSKPEKLSLAAKHYNFAPTEDFGLTYDTYGTELDFTATWKHSNNVSVKAYYAEFTPDSKFQAVNDDATNILGTSFMVKF
ncbi:MAG: alginate export family protein [Elusimicrobia bacterium]|nr:alginate export family protein [Elusimicrobiota bacterium]